MFKNKNNIKIIIKLKKCLIYNNIIQYKKKSIILSYLSEVSFIKK